MARGTTTTTAKQTNNKTTKRWLQLSLLAHIMLGVSIVESRKLHKVGVRMVRVMSDGDDDCYHTSWSGCSRDWCGTGEATRVRQYLIEGGTLCEYGVEKRMCRIRPCEDDDIRQGNLSACTRRPAIGKRERISYQDARSDRKYRLKYCSQCDGTDGCCRPSKTSTRLVKFRRVDGRRFKMRVMFIRKCKCSDVCPEKNPPFLGYDVRNDTLRHDDDVSITQEELPPETQVIPDDLEDELW